jgi:hypothetical protein
VVIHEEADVKRLNESGEMSTMPNCRTVVEFVRLDYDIQKAVRKILDNPELDDFLGTRLLEGR